MDGATQRAPRGGSAIVARSVARRRAVARWGRFALMTGVTAVVLAPLAIVVLRAVTGFDGRFSLQGLLLQLASPRTLGWFGNSLVITAGTVVVTTLIAAPAGYVLSRGRGRGVDAFAIAVFGLQSLPIVLLLVPLFVLFVPLGLVDNLFGLTVAYVGLAVAIAIWTMSTFFDAIPVALEEAAWLDGLSVAGAFRRVVLPNAAPGLLSTAVIVFLFAWNDYWIGLTLIVSDQHFTVSLALASAGRTPALALLALLPPVLVFAVLHRVFRFGGVGGALAN